MQSYDLLMVAVLAATTAFGAWKGMAWQIASLSSLILSYLVAQRFSDDLAPHISGEAPWNRFAAMLVLYVGTAATIWFMFAMVKQTISRIQLREFDRQIGALFGAAKGVIVCLVITFFVVTLSEGGRTRVLESRSGKYLAQLIDESDSIMPAEVHQVLGPYLDRLRNGLDPNAEPMQNPNLLNEQQVRDAQQLYDAARNATLPALPAGFPASSYPAGQQAGYSETAPPTGYAPSAVQPYYNSNRGPGYPASPGVSR